VELYSKDLNIKLSHVVSEIDHSQKKIKIKTNKGNFTADFCICTISLGCLKKETIKFIPELPEKKKKAIKSLGMGVYVKVIVN
jgi:monoamine oxidase